MRPGRRPLGRAFRCATTRRQGGFTYLAMLALLAVLAVGLAAIGPLWSDQVHRERERDLLRVGQIYAAAIAHYYESSPGGARQYPHDLSELLNDTRFVGTVRHLRQLYPDPLDPARPWGLVLGPEGTVRGVYSQSQDAPFRREALTLTGVNLPAATHYTEWQFVPMGTP